MPKSKKPKLKVYTISETIHVCYQVVATSEEDAQEHYRNLDLAGDFQTLLMEAASNNFCDDEVVNDEEYSEDSHSFIDKTDKAKEATR